MRDIMCSGYVAGANTGFFGAKGEEAFASSLKGPVSSDAVKLDISSRLSFDDEERGEYQSMLAFACGYGDGAKRDQVISITDRLLPWEVHGSDTAKTYFPGGPDNYRAYRKAWELHTLHFGEDVRAAENMEFISQGSSNNGLCFIGPHRKYNPYSNLYHELIPGQGHFGPVSNAHRTITLTKITNTQANVFRPCALGRMRSQEMHVGVVERRYRSKRPGIPWCRSRLRRTRRCTLPRNLKLATFSTKKNPCRSCALQTVYCKRKC